MSRSAALGFWSILLMGVALMIPATLYDYAWTHYLHEHRIDWLKDFMADSIFELEMLGGGDLAVLLLIAVALSYLLSWMPEYHQARPNQLNRYFSHWLERRTKFAERLRSMRPHLGFMVVASLCCAVYLIHATKWIMGRPRPGYVFSGQLPYSEWYEVGWHFISQGHYRGSFPSGHTATVFMYMALAYALWDLLKPRRQQAWAVGLGLFALCLAGLMMASRSMSGAHWVADSVFIIFFNWLFIHLLYHLGGLIGPRAMAQPRPFYFELKISFYLFLVAFGCFWLFMGLRALWLGEWTWLALGIPVGGWLIFRYIRLAHRAGLYPCSQAKRQR